tara:strand:- start:371 stop:667 length:297 start_codon:yes stop_codon:yes gene_type:complete
MKRTQLKKLIKDLIFEQRLKRGRGGRLTPAQENMIKQEIRNTLKDPSLGLTGDQQQKTWMLITFIVLTLIGKIFGDGVSGGGGGSDHGQDPDFPPEYL